MKMRSLLVILALVAANAFAQQARNVRISFLPPPQEGTISLGIYDSNGRLVRVLHREAELEEFKVGADSLSTTWDGKDDEGRDVPSGRYSARGFAVAEMKIEEVTQAGSDAFRSNDKVNLKLIANTLAPNERSSVDLLAGFDEDGSFVKTADGLPLFTVDECPGLFAVSLSSRPDRSLDLTQTDGDTIDQFHIVGAQNMMAFDAGEFELK